MKLKSSAPSSLGPKPIPKPVTPAKAGRASDIDESSQPVPLCNKCGEVLDARGVCSACKGGAATTGKGPAPKPVRPVSSSGSAGKSTITKSGSIPVPPLPDDDDIIELGSKPQTPARKPAASPVPGAGLPKPKAKAPPLPPMAGIPKPGGTSATPKPGAKPGSKPDSTGKKPSKSDDSGEDDFWNAVES